MAVETQELVPPTPNSFSKTRDVGAATILGAGNLRLAVWVWEGGFVIADLFGATGYVSVFASPRRWC